VNCMKCRAVFDPHECRVVRRPVEKSKNGSA
jgi:hypothetical protein